MRTAYVLEIELKMKQEITKWYKKNATIAKATAALALTVPYTAYIRSIQKDLDEVRYSREINKKLASRKEYGNKKQVV